MSSYLAVLLTFVRLINSLIIFLLISQMVFGSGIRLIFIVDRGCTLDVGCAPHDVKVKLEVTESDLFSFFFLLPLLF